MRIKLICTLVTARMATLVMIAMLRSTNANPLLVFMVRICICFFIFFVCHINIASPLLVSNACLLACSIISLKLFSFSVKLSCIQFQSSYALPFLFTTVFTAGGTVGCFKYHTATMVRPLIKHRLQEFLP